MCAEAPDYLIFTLWILDESPEPTALSARSRTLYDLPAVRRPTTKTRCEFFLMMIQDLPFSEYWYFVMGLPPFSMALVSVIDRALLAAEETRIEGRPGTDLFVALEDWVVAVLLAAE